MKKSGLKVFIKSILITFGVLCILAGSFNPFVYYFGAKTTASCDNVQFTQKEGDVYSCVMDYHYFVNGKQYKKVLMFDGAFDENLQYDIHNVNYFPLIPSFGTIDVNYRIPTDSIIFSGLGLLLIAVGIFIRAAKKEKAPKKENEAIKYLCPACKSEIDHDSIFCSQCGRKIL